MTGPATTVADLLLPDPASAADLAMLVTRARRVEPDGAVRLLARGEVLAVFVCVVGPPAATGGPTVLGLRTLRLAGPAEADVVVPLGAVADRCARIAAAHGDGSGPVPFPLPPVQVSVPWAGVSPPLGGWRPAGRVPAGLLLDAARAGAAQIAAGTPAGAGSAAVAKLRGLVWGQQLADGEPADGEPADGEPADGGLPTGLGFAADLLGFARAGDPDLPVHRVGRWVRVTAQRGYLLARRPTTL